MDGDGSGLASSIPTNSYVAILGWEAGACAFLDNCAQATQTPYRFGRLERVGRPSLTSPSSLAFLAQGGSGRTMEGGW